VGLVVAILLVGCSAVFAPRVEKSDLVGTWKDSTGHASIELDADGSASLNGIPRGAVMGDRDKVYGQPVELSGAWAYPSSGELPARTTNGGEKDRYFLITGNSSWPISPLRVDVAREGGQFVLRWELGDPDSDVWYVLTK